MEKHPFARVENYTTPALVFLGINLIWIFGVIWFHLGLGGVFLLAAGLNYVITRIGERIARHEAAMARFDRREPEL